MTSKVPDELLEDDPGIYQDLLAERDEAMERVGRVQDTNRELRAEVLDFARRVVEQDQEIAAFRGENESLKQELGSDEAIDRAVWKARAERAEAENERLTGAIERCDKEMDRLNSALVDKQAEVERLTGLIVGNHPRRDEPTTALDADECCSHCVCQNTHGDSDCPCCHQRAHCTGLRKPTTPHTDTTSVRE